MKSAENFLSVAVRYVLQKCKQIHVYHKTREASLPVTNYSTNKSRSENGFSVCLKWTVAELRKYLKDRVVPSNVMQERTGGYDE